MPIVLTDNFTVSSNVDIAAYPVARANYAYNNGASSNLIVDAATDRALCNISNVTVSARIIHVDAPRINQRISADIFCSGSFASGEVQARCGLGNYNNYAVKIELTQTAGQQLRLYRNDGGTYTLLATGTGVIALSSGAYKVSLMAIGIETVKLFVWIGDQLAITYDDTSGNKKISGPPGIGVWSDAFAVNTAYVDNVVVEEVVINNDGIPIHVGGSITIATDDVAGQQVQKFKTSYESDTLTIPLETSDAVVATSTSVPQSTAEALANNASGTRKWFSIQNLSDVNTVYVKFGGTITGAADFTFKLPPRAIYRSGFPCYQGSINVSYIVGSLSGSVRVIRCPS